MWVLGSEFISLELPSKCSYSLRHHVCGVCVCMPVRWSECGGHWTTCKTQSLLSLCPMDGTECQVWHFYLCKWLCTSAYCQAVKRGPWNWTFRGLLVPTVALGIETVSSGRGASVFNNWVISPTLPCLILTRTKCKRVESMCSPRARAR
jgi:hypothetical protein